MSDPDELVLLVESDDPIERATWRGLLEGAAIPFVIQGEQHASVVPGLMGLPVLVPRILVPARELERAQALLAAAPDARFEGTLAEGTCPVHEKPAIGTCDRCGSFLCADCRPTSTPPVCEACTGFEARQHDDARAGKDRFVKAVVYALIGLVALLFVMRFLV